MENQPLNSIERGIESVLLFVNRRYVLTTSLLRIEWVSVRRVLLFQEHPFLILASHILLFQCSAFSHYVNNNYYFYFTIQGKKRNI